MARCSESGDCKANYYCDSNLCIPCSHGCVTADICHTLCPGFWPTTAKPSTKHITTTLREVDDDIRKEIIPTEGTNCNVQESMIVNQNEQDGTATIVALVVTIVVLATVIMLLVIFIYVKLYRRKSPSQRQSLEMQQPTNNSEGTRLISNGTTATRNIIGLQLVGQNQLTVKMLTISEDTWCNEGQGRITAPTDVLRAAGVGNTCPSQPPDQTESLTPPCDFSLKVENSLGDGNDDLRTMFLSIVDGIQSRSFHSRPDDPSASNNESLQFSFALPGNENHEQEASRDSDTDVFKTYVVVNTDEIAQHDKLQMNIEGQEDNFKTAHFDSSIGDNPN